MVSFFHSFFLFFFFFFLSLLTCLFYSVLFCSGVVLFLCVFACLFVLCLGCLFWVCLGFFFFKLQNTRGIGRFSCMLSQGQPFTQGYQRAGVYLPYILTEPDLSLRRELGWVCLVGGWGF